MSCVLRHSITPLPISATLAFLLRDLSLLAAGFGWDCSEVRLVQAVNESPTHTVVMGSGMCITQSESIKCREILVDKDSLSFPSVGTTRGDALSSSK